MGSADTPEVSRALAAEIAALRDSAYQRLEHLVGMESPSGDLALLDPLADELADGFTAAGAVVDREAGAAGDHLVITVPAATRGGHLLVLGHYDTVLPRGHITEHPFDVRDGRASGPGVFDMKGGLVALETALRALSRLGLEPAQPVRALVVSDEEVGSPDGARLVRREAADAAAVFGLEPPNPGGGLKTGRRGVARVSIEVTGHAAHAGLDAGRGVSATDELVDQLLALRTAVPAEPGVAVNVGTLAGGGRANVVAAAAAAEIGLRYATAAEESAVFAAFDGLTPVRVGATVTVRRLSHRPAWPAPRHNPLLDHVRAVATDLGQSPPDGAPSGGAGDTNLTGALGRPTLDGFGPRGRGAHGPDEVVELESIIERATLLAALIVTPLPSDGHTAP